VTGEQWGDLICAQLGGRGLEAEWAACMEAANHDMGPKAASPPPGWTEADARAIQELRSMPQEINALRASLTGPDRAAQARAFGRWRDHVLTVEAQSMARLSALLWMLRTAARVREAVPDMAADAVAFERHVHSKLRALWGVLPDAMPAANDNAERTFAHERARLYDALPRSWRYV